jgi:protein SFI1
MARQQFLMQGAINRLLKRQMSAAWEKWQQVYADLKFANRMGGGAIRRMLNRKLSMAWEKWQFEAAESQRQRMLMLRSAMRWVQEIMARAFFTWKTISSEMWRTRQGMRRAVGKFMMRGLARAWNKWVDFAVEKKAIERNARRAMLRWKNQGLSRGFVTWAAWFAECKAQQANLKRSLMRWVKSLLSRAYQTWYAKTVGKPKTNSFERAAKYLLSAGLGRYFANWRRISSAMSRRDAMLDKMNNRFSSETMSLMEQLQAALRRIAQLEESLSNQAPQENLDKELDAAERARKRAEMELEAARKRLQDLLTSGDVNAEALERAIRDLRDAEDELARANSIIAKLKARIAELEEELRKLRAELARNAQQANDEWLSQQAHRKAQEKAAARQALLEAERLRKEAEEEAARRKLLLSRQEGDDQNNKIRRMIAHWLQGSLTRALNTWRDEARWLRRIEAIMKRVALRWKKDKAYKLLVKLRDYAEAQRIKKLEFQAYLTKSKTPTSRARASSRGTYVSSFQATSPKNSSKK